MMTSSPAPLPSTGQEPLLRLLFEQAPGFIAVMEGPDHVFTLVNPAYQRLVGLRELIGKPAREAVPEAVEHGFIDILDQVLASGEPFVAHHASLLLQRSAGTQPERRFLDFVYQPLLDRAGRVAGIFCEGHDVTEAVENADQLAREVMQRTAQACLFDTVLSSIADFAYTFDLEGRFAYSNQPLLELLGLKLEDVVGKTFLQLPYPPELGARLHAEIRQVVETGQQVKGESYYRSPTGKEGWYEYIFNPVHGSDGAVAAIAGSTRDVTWRREQQRQLSLLNDAERAARAEAERADRLKDEFLATLSHELRTPLNAIQSWADLLRSGRLAPEQVKDAGERISRNARAQAQLVADLLDTQGIVSGKVRLELARGPVSRPLLAAIDAVRIEAQRKGVALLGPELPDGAEVEIDADPDRLQQVFWNLLANALKFTPPGGTISVRLDSGPAGVATRITDSGIGISPEFLPHLFERFSQADSSSTRGQGGLGLGLSICKSLVEMHGGRIEASSAGGARGATFTVTIPAEPAGLTVPSRRGSADNPGTDMPRAENASVLQGASILIVDDDEDGREVLGMILRQYGASIATAGNADEAFDRLQASAPDLVICDIGMPVVDGYQLLWRIRKHSQVPAIAFTAFARPEDVKQALESGFAAHIAKPAAAATTIRVCAEVLQRSAAAHPA